MRSQQSFMSFMNNKDSAIARRDADRLCCAKCRFSTKDPDLFGRHVSHHKEVTFSCALCSHVSYSKTESQKHIVAHTGSYPYRCSFCSYGAVRRDYMVKHILRIHKKDADEGLITDGAVPPLACRLPSVPETPGTSGWPKRSDQGAVPSTHAEHPSGSQPRINRCPGPAQMSSTCARGTYPSPGVPNTAATPLSRTQLSGTAPSATHTPQVVLRSREENGNWSNSPFNAFGPRKSANRRATLEKPLLKPTFPRVQFIPTEAPQQSPRVGVPERAMYPKTIPRVQIRTPVGVTAPLRTLLNVPLSKSKVPCPTPSTTRTNVAMQKTTAVVPSVPAMLSTVERSSPTRTDLRTGSLVPRLSPLSSVQVELLAPLNQPIQHNKPLTVSCPEEINIPAGCLVELVEVKNVNGARELELRLIPPNGALQEQTSAVDEPEGKLSFKCQVAAKESPVGPSTSSAVRSTSIPVHSAHKPQHSETPVRNKLNLRNRGPGVKRTAAHEGAAPEGLPVISSVFSLCPPPKVPHSVPQSSQETQHWTVATKDTKVDMRNAEPLGSSVLVKKEEEPEEKHKGTCVDLRETKTEDEDTQDSSAPEDRRPATTSGDQKHATPPPAAPIAPPNKTSAPHPEESGRKDQQQQSSASLMYPKVTLVRIPSSMLEPVTNLPETPTPDQSLTARPVLCCSLREQNVSGGPEVSIKLILKRDLRESEDRDPPPRKKHKKDKKKARKHRTPAVETGPRQPSVQLRLTPLKANQMVTRPGPNQPVVVLNHPSPSVQTVSVAVQTLKDYKWVSSPGHEGQAQPSLKMKLKKLHGQTYQVIALVLR